MTNSELLPTLDQKKVREAAAYIAKSMDKQTLLSFLGAIWQDPESWWVQWHLHGGMGLRNHMRDGGFGEEDLGVENLDDVYLPIFYMALASRAMQLINEGDKEEVSDDEAES